MADFVPWSANQKSGSAKSVRLESNGDITVKRSYNLDPFVEYSKAVQNSGKDGYNADKSMRRVGHIPEGLQRHIMDTEGVNILAPGNEDRLLKALMDPDLRYLVRTNDSRLSLVNGEIR